MYNVQLVINTNYYTDKESVHILKNEYPLCKINAFFCLQTYRCANIFKIC